MLVLQRRIGQRIMIGNDIEVIILSIDGRQVSVGVVAPKDIRVDREEVRARIQAGLSEGKPAPEIAPV